MLSVVPIKSSSIQTGYYLKEEGNYHIENAKEKELYQWMGKGAEKQGLVGAVTKEQYFRVFSGVLPSGEMLGRRNKEGELLGRAGYDLTFSLNKDISLIICCSKDKELSNYFLEAHKEAVKTAMIEVEKMVSARTTVDGVTSYEPTKNMIAALCTHFVSRAGDPQVHTHALVANATQRQDGQWRALSSDISRKDGFIEKVMDNATFFGHIYQNEMACAAKDAGFRVKPAGKHGFFKIEGMPKGAAEHFSKRREQIVEKVDSLKNADKTNKKLFDLVAEKSRAPKEEILRVDFYKKAEKEMKAYMESSLDGRDYDQALNEAREVKEKQPYVTNRDALAAIQDATTTLSAFNTELNPMRIVESAMEFSTGSLHVADINRELENCIKKGKFMRTASGSLVSKKLVQKENDFIALVREHADLNKGKIAANADISGYLNKTRICVQKEPDQLKRREMAIKEMISTLEKEGKKVTLLTQSKSLACSYNQSNKEENSTLRGQLARIGQADKAQSIHGFIYQYEKSIHNPISNYFAKKGKEVFIIEDANTISIDVAEKLIKATEKREASLVFLSYEKGSKALSAGNVVSLLEKSGIPKLQAANGKEKEKEKSSQYQFIETTVPKEVGPQDKQYIRQRELAREVVREYGESLESVQILSASKDSASKQTACMRDALQEAGILGKEEVNLLTEQKVYLSSEKRKKVQFYKKGWVAKTYLGRGQFSEKEIQRLDKESNQLIVKGLLGREKPLTPEKLIKGKDTYLVERRTIGIADGDRIRLHEQSAQSKRLGLSLNTSYRVHLSGSSMTLTPSNSRLKPKKTRISHLNGLDIRHDYVKTVSDKQSISQLKGVEKAVVDLPSYRVNQAVMADLSRQYDKIQIYTDNQAKAMKRSGVDGSRVLASDIVPVPEEPPKPLIERAVSYGLDILSSREAAFTSQSVLEKIFSYELAPANLKGIQNEFKSRFASGALQTRESPEGDELIATKETIEMEKDIIRQIESGKSAVSPFLEKSVIEERLASTRLTQGQKDACVLLGSTADRFVMIQGYAGTGKSTMLKTLKKTLETEGVIKKEDLIALGPTHKAVKELQEKGMKAQTLKSFLIEKQELGEEGAKQLAGKLVLLDESSMVSNRDFKELQDIVEKAGSCHCAYIGDKAQLLAVEAGKPSELAYISKEADILVATMGEVLRQVDPALKVVANNLMVGTPKSVKNAIQVMDNAGLILESAIQKADASGGTKERRESPILNMAKFYMKMPKEERDQTLIAVATNKSRREANGAIRGLMKKQGEIQGPSILSSILVDSMLTNAELAHFRNYNVGQVVKVNRDYFQITGKDNETKSLLLRGEDGQQTAMNLKSLPKETILSLFSVESIEIQAGDNLKWTKTDKERGVVSHERMDVLSIHGNGLVRVKTVSGKEATINTNSFENSHIDYSYTSTVHGLQGATDKSVISVLDSHQQKSNNMRLLYVAATRATHNAWIFTDNLKELTDQVTQQRGDKYSALEAMGCLPTKERPLEIPVGQAKVSDQAVGRIKSRDSKLGSHKSRTPALSRKQTFKKIDSKLVESALREQVRSICDDVLGERNVSLSNESSWRYGNKGSLCVQVDGPHKGTFNNFETGEKGGMISLLMADQGIDFKTALEQAERMLGGDLSMLPERRESVAIKQRVVDTGQARKQKYMESLISKSTSIKGTVAEKYLNNRAIKTPDNTDIRFLRDVDTGRGNREVRQSSSALLVVARNENLRPKAIQMTYLDPMTGDKVSGLPIPKRTIGSLHESSVNLTPEVKSPHLTLAAEGIETALSIRDSLTKDQQNQTQILATLGKSNLPKVVGNNSADRIVLALDNDKTPWDQDKSIKSAVEQIKASGKEVSCIQPQLLNGQKTDYNDLVQAGKTLLIQQDIKQGLSQFQEADKTQTISGPSPTEITRSPNPDFSKAEKIQDREIER